MKWNNIELEKWNEKAPGKFIEKPFLTHYIEKGKGDPIILLHGYFFDHHLWDYNIDELAKYYKVYALDLWGFGYSSRDEHDHSYNLYCQQTLSFMTTLNIDSAHFIGQSMGGGTIIKLALDHPKKIKSMTLIDPSGMPNPQPLIAKIFSLKGVGEFFLNRPGMSIRRKNMMKFWVHNKSIATKSFMETMLAHHQVKGTTYSLLNILRNNFWPTLLAEIKQLSDTKIPCHIIWGRDEKGIPLETGQTMANIIKKASFHIIEEAGHAPNLDQAEIVNSIILHNLNQYAYLC